MTNEEILIVLRNYTEDDWYDWIDDIFIHNTAFPIAKMFEHGDALKDIVFLLRNNSIPTTKYESAIVNKIRQIESPYSKTDVLVRLLETIALLKTPRAKSTLLSLMVSKDLSMLQVENTSLKTIILQAISRIELETNEKADILEHILIGERDLISSDPVFSSQYLRFLRLHFEESIYFDGITFISHQISQGVRTKESFQAFIEVLGEAFWEYHYYADYSFHGSVYRWLCKNHNLLLNEMMVNLIEEVNKFYATTHIQKEIEIEGSEQSKFGKSNNFILLLLIQDEQVLQKGLQEWIDNIVFCINNNGSELLDKIFKRNSDFVRDNFFIYQDYLFNKSTEYAQIEEGKIRELFLEALDQPYRITRNLSDEQIDKYLKNEKRDPDIQRISQQRKNDLFFSDN